MRLTLWRRYEIESAHQLTAGVPEGHKCRRLHGHRYIVTLGVEGDIIADTGMLIEYTDLDTQVLPVLKRIDHYSINTLRERDSTAAAEAVSENPTVELICAWLVDALGFLRQERQLRLVAVKVEEDSAASVEWRA